MQQQLNNVTLARSARSGFACRVLIIVGVLIAGVIGLLAWVFIWPAFKPTQHITITIPTNYRGVVIIVKDGDRGQSSRGNPIEWTVPESGVLRVRDLDAFFEWHKVTCRYADGTELTNINWEGGANATGKVFALASSIGSRRVLIMNVGHGIEDIKKEDLPTFEWVRKCRRPLSLVRDGLVIRSPTPQPAENSTELFCVA